MTIQLKPLGNRVLIKKSPVDETSQGGIILTSSQQDKQSSRGEVLAVGPGKVENGTHQAMQVKVGDVVVIGQYSGTEVGEELLLVSEDDILAIDQT